MGIQPIHLRGDMETLEEMQSQYRNLCAQLGDLHYKIQIFKREETKLVSEILNLDEEYGKIKNATTANEAGQATEELATTPTAQ